MENRYGTPGDEQQRRRLRRAPHKRRHADVAMTTTIHPSGGDGPRIDERCEEAEAPGAAASDGSGNMSRPEKSSPPCAGECGAVLRDAAAGDHQRHRPREHADRECHRAAEQRAGRAAAGAMRAAPAASSGRVSHIACDRMPMASADRNAPSDDHAGPTAASAAGSCVVCGSRWRTKADASAACAASAKREPRHIAERAQRGKPVQRTMRSRRASRVPARRSRSSRRSRSPIERLDASEQPHQRKYRQRAEDRAEQRQRAWRRTAHTACDELCRAR